MLKIWGSGDHKGIRNRQDQSAHSRTHMTTWGLGKVQCSVSILCGTTTRTNLGRF